MSMASLIEACVRQRFEKRSATRRNVFVMNRTGSFQNSTGVSVREPPQPRSLHFKLSWRQRSCDPVMGAERIVRVRHQYNWSSDSEPSLSSRTCAPLPVSQRDLKGISIVIVVRPSVRVLPTHLKSSLSV